MNVPLVLCLPDPEPASVRFTPEGGHDADAGLTAIASFPATR